MANLRNLQELPQIGTFNPNASTDVMVTDDMVGGSGTITGQSRAAAIMLALDTIHGLTPELFNISRRLNLLSHVSEKTLNRLSGVLDNMDEIDADPALKAETIAAIKQWKNEVEPMIDERLSTMPLYAVD